MSRLRVCALVPYPLGSVPSQRYRLEQWAPLLAEDGIQLDLIPFADSRLMDLLHRPGHAAAKLSFGVAAVWRRIELMARLDRYDVVVVHRAALLGGPAWIERLMARRRPLVFDFDDAVWVLHTTAANRRLGWMKFPGKTTALCRISAQVVVGNERLAEYARPHNPNVTVVSSSVDTDVYRPVLRASRDCVVVGWMGSSTSQTHLELFAPMLHHIARLPNVELRIHSDRQPELPGVDHTWHPWSAATEVRDLQDFDIGIMPMPDDSWARGKGAMKALLYMAVGVAAVCSPVGTNLDVIRDGTNGLLAATEDDWRNAIQRLVEDVDLRRRIGAAGRTTIETRYSRAHSAARFGEVLRRAAKS